MTGKRKWDDGGWTPHKDLHGSLGRSDRRYKEVWAESIRGTNNSYTSTMTADETFTDTNNNINVYALDPNGSDRTFNPSGTFRAGCVAIIKNLSTTNRITFDSTASNQEIAPGQFSITFYDGTAWR